MATHGRGLICLPMTERARCDQLGLEPMVRRNDGAHTAPRSPSPIEARRGITTGISAADRAAHDHGR